MTIRTNATGAAFVVTERRAQGKYDLFLDEIEVIIGIAMRNGAATMSEIIMTEGVKDTVPNSNGRIDSGDMLGDIKHRVKRNSRGRIQGEAGWIPGERRQKYYGWQESGTYAKGQPEGRQKAPGTGNRGIRPMMAMKTANEQMTAEIEAQLARYRR